MTTAPSAGPASAYPTFSTPALICFSVPNDVCVPGLILGRSAGFAALDCASAEPLTTSWAPAMVIAAVPRKRRRSWLIGSDILIVSIGESPWVRWLAGTCSARGCGDLRDEGWLDALEPGSRRPCPEKWAFRLEMARIYPPDGHDFYGRLENSAWRQPAGLSVLLYRFEDLVLDTNRRELRRGHGLVAVEPQVFDLLEFLIRARDRVVSRDDLLAAVWQGRIVSEATLSSRVNSARAAIGDSGEEQRLIKTLPRKGVRFVGAVREESDPPSRPVVEA